MHRARSGRPAAKPQAPTRGPYTVARPPRPAPRRRRLVPPIALPRGIGYRPASYERRRTGLSSGHRPGGLSRAEGRPFAGRPEHTCATRRGGRPAPLAAGRHARLARHQAALSRVHAGSALADPVHRGDGLRARRAVCGAVSHQRARVSAVPGAVAGVVGVSLHRDRRRLHLLHRQRAADPVDAHAALGACGARAGAQPAGPGAQRDCHRRRLPVVLDLAGRVP